MICPNSPVQGFLPHVVVSKKNNASPRAHYGGSESIAGCCKSVLPTAGFKFVPIAAHDTTPIHCQWGHGAPAQALAQPSSVRYCVTARNSTTSSVQPQFPRPCRSTKSTCSYWAATRNAWRAV